MCWGAFGAGSLPRQRAENPHPPPSDTHPTARQPFPAVCEVAWVGPSALADNPHPTPLCHTHLSARQPFPAVCEVIWVSPSALAENPHPTPLQQHLTARQPFPAVCEVAWVAPPLPWQRTRARLPPTHALKPGNHSRLCVKSHGSPPPPWQRTRTQRPYNTHPTARQSFPAVSEVALVGPSALAENPHRTPLQHKPCSQANNSRPFVRSLGSAPLPWQRTRTRLLRHTPRS